MLYTPNLVMAGRTYPIVTRAYAITQNIPAPILVIMTSGYVTDGDGGGAEYKRVAVEPVHAGKFQSNDGAWWEICSLDINVKMFGAVGDGVTDDRQAIVDAISYTSVVEFPSGNYAISSPIELNSNNTLYGSGEVVPIPVGYVDRYLFLIDVGADNIRVSLEFDGDNMPNPIAAWTGAGAGVARAPVGSAIFVNGTSAISVDISNIYLNGSTFRNFPSGPVCAFYTDNIKVTGCKAFDNQTYVANETNAIFHLHGCVNSTQFDSYISGLNFKGFYFANSLKCALSELKVFGGVAGHSGVYVNGGSGYTVNACMVADGQGFKAFTATDIEVTGFHSVNSSGSGFYLQACTDVVATGVKVTDPTTQGIILESADGFGDLTRVKIDSWEVNYSAAGTGVNETSIYVASGNATTITDVTVSGGVSYNAFFGGYCIAVANGVVDGLNILNNEFINSVQYSFLAYVKSGKFVGNTVRTAYADVAVQFYSQSNVAGTTLTIAGNDIYLSNGAATGIDVGTLGAAGQSRFTVLKLGGNTVTGGNVAIRYNGNGSLTDLLKVLEVSNNIGFDNAAANAIALTMNATNVTPCSNIFGNTLVNTAGARKNIIVNNSVAITNKVDASNNVGALTYA